MNKFYNDHFQNYKSYGIPKAQLVIVDIPYNVGENAYGSNPQWYIDGDNKNGQSKLAGKSFFNTDNDFRISEFLHFCSKLMKKEPKAKGQAPAMVVFCAFDQQMEIIQKAKKYGINKYINLVFKKKFSAQVLKANMRIVGNAEYALLLYRNKLPKFNNDNKMFFNVMDWEMDNKKSILYEKIHPNQKPVVLLEKLIKLFTDPGEVVIDPAAGSGSTIIAAENLGRKAYGFEINKHFYHKAQAWLHKCRKIRKEMEGFGSVASMCDAKQLSIWS